MLKAMMAHQWTDAKKPNKRIAPIGENQEGGGESQREGKDDVHGDHLETNKDRYAQWVRRRNIETQ